VQTDSLWEANRATSAQLEVGVSIPSRLLALLGPIPPQRALRLSRPAFRVLLARTVPLAPLLLLRVLLERTTLPPAALLLPCANNVQQAPTVQVRNNHRGRRMPLLSDACTFEFRCLRCVAWCSFLCSWVLGAYRVCRWTILFDRWSWLVEHLPAMPCGILVQR
jgi:hypothetical protein